METLDDDKPILEKQIDVKLFLEHLQLKFNRIMDQITQNITKPKDLVVIDSIRPIFELIIDKQSMKERNTSLVWLKPATINQYQDQEVEVLVFFVPPEREVIELITLFLETLKKKGIKKQNHIIFYPKRTVLSKFFLEDNAISSRFENRVYDFNFDLIPLSNDLLSLEYPLSLDEIFKTKEFNVHNLVAESLQRIQLVFGKIPTFVGKGKHARTVMDILSRLEKEHAARLKYDKELQEIDGCVLLDREVDMLTPMCTQMTYNGLLDEILTIQCNAAQIDKEVVNITEGSKDGKMNFYFSDFVFEGIKDKNISVLGKYLQSKLIEYQKLVQNRDNFNDLSMAAKITKEIKKKRAIEPHVNIAFYINSIIQKPLFREGIKYEAECLMGTHNSDEMTTHIENLITGREPLEQIYRLLIIQTIVEGGLKPKVYANIKKEIIETYGLNQVITLNEFDEMGLIYEGIGNSKKSPFLKTKKDFNLLDLDYTQEKLETQSQPYNAYVPLTNRLVEMAVRNGWTKDDGINGLPGPRFLKGNPSNLVCRSDRRKVILVYGIGGFTYGEIAGIRKTAETFNVEILICVTNIVDCKRLLQSIVEKS